ncbi:MAG: hypothetical protein LBT19_01750 [Candidatus Nomurabacteria bacterium]|jgi:hypothetical protein|nr:hypothetical protein [Candidatus Nomurabacteria bacterium]
MENQDSVSIIESPREAELRAEAERAKQVLALEEAANRKVRAVELRNKIIKISMIVLGVLLAVALVGAIIWLVINAVSAVRNPVGDVGSNGDTPGDNLPIVAGYQCATTKCNKVTDLPDGRFLMRDTEYYIYDSDSGVALKTTIPEKNYHAIVPFVWGSETLAVLDPDTGRSALYSISRNQQVGDFNYDDFYIEPGDALYKDMKWIIGKYIIAKHDTAVRLLDVFDGSEVVRAQNKVFAYSPYFFGYDADGERRAYLEDGSRILIAVKGDYLFVRDKRLIRVGVKALTTMEIYDQAGKKLQSNDEYYKKLQEALSGKQNYATAIGAMSGTYKVPE